MSTLVWGELYHCLWSISWKNGIRNGVANEGVYISNQQHLWVSHVLGHNYTKVAALVEMVLPLGMCNQRLEVYEGLWWLASGRQAWCQPVPIDLECARLIVKSHRCKRAEKLLLQVSVRVVDGHLIGLPKELVARVLDFI